MRLAIIAAFALVGCATSGANLATRAPDATHRTANTPAEVADCIVLNTPGLYTPLRTGTDTITIGWRQEPAGQIASFTIRPDGKASTVEVRKIGLVDRHIANVRRCYT